MQKSYECGLAIHIGPESETHPRIGQAAASSGAWTDPVHYGVPTNRNALWIFRFHVGRLWRHALSRRSQNGRVLWDRMRRLITRWWPLPSVCHPYTLRRMGVVTQGKSRMRDTRLSRIRGGGREQS